MLHVRTKMLSVVPTSCGTDHFFLNYVLSLLYYTAYPHPEKGIVRVGVWRTKLPEINGIYGTALHMAQYKEEASLAETHILSIG